MRGLKLIQLITPTTPRERADPDRPHDHGVHLLCLGRGDHRRALRPSRRSGRNRRLAADPDRLADLHRLRDQRSRPGAPACPGGGRPDRRQRDRAPAGRGGQPAPCRSRPRDRPVRRRPGPGARRNAGRDFRLTRGCGNVVGRIGQLTTDPSFLARGRGWTSRSPNACTASWARSAISWFATVFRSSPRSCRSPSPSWCPT